MNKHKVSHQQIKGVLFSLFVSVTAVIGLLFTLTQAPWTVYADTTMATSLLLPLPVTDYVCNSATQQAGSNSSLTISSFSACGGSDDFIAVAASYRAVSWETHAVSSMTFGGEPLTFGCRQHSNEYATEIWYLSNPTAVSANITVNWQNGGSAAAAEDIVIGAAAFADINTTTPSVQVQCENDGGSWSRHPAVAIAAAGNAVLFGAATTYTGGDNRLIFDGDAAQALWRQETTNTASAGAVADGQTTSTLSWTGTGTTNWPWSTAAIAVATTAPAPPVVNILLVDDDAADPGSLADYTAALDAVGAAYTIWDTGSGANEPDASDLAAYDTAVWFSGDANGGFAGPGSDGELALATWLDGGPRCLFLSSQNYYEDRGTLSSFMTNYLGVDNVVNDWGYDYVFDDGYAQGLFPGTYSLSALISKNDVINPDSTADPVFLTDAYTVTAISKISGVLHTMYWGFPFEQLDVAPEEKRDMMRTVLNWCADDTVYAQGMDGYNSSYTLSSDTAVANVDTVTIDAVLRDVDGIVLRNRSLDLRYDNGQAYDVLAAATTDNEGNIHFEFSWSELQTLYLTLYDPLYDADMTIGDVSFVTGSINPDDPNTLIEISPNPAIAGIDEVGIYAELFTESGYPPYDHEIELLLNGEVVDSSFYYEGDSGINFYYNSYTAGTYEVTLHGVDDDISVAAGSLLMQAGLADSYLSTVMITPTSIVSDGLDTAVISATLLDTYGNPLSDRDLSWFVEGTRTSFYYLGAGLTDAAGTAVYTLTWDTPEILELVIYNALPDGTNSDYLYTGKLITVTGIGPDPLLSTVALTPTTVIANGVDAAIISATLRTEFNTPLTDYMMQLRRNGSVTTDLFSDGDGIINYLLRSTVVGTETVDLYDPLSGTALPLPPFVVDFVAAEPSRVEADRTTLVADGQETAVITVTLRDIRGDPVVSGTVDLLVSGNYNRINGTSVSNLIWTAIGQTNSNGVVTATVSATRAESKQVTARYNGTIVAAPVTLNFMADAAAQLQTLLPGEVAIPGSSGGRSGTPLVPTAGMPFTLTIRAVDPYWNLVTAVSDTIDLESVDPQATLPATVDLYQGQHVVSMTLRTAGTQPITATDVSDSLLIAAVSVPVVKAAAAAQLTLDMTPPAFQRYQPVAAVVTLYDSYDNIATGYTGQVAFTSTDLQATLPATYTFISGDGGQHTFSGLVFRSSGAHTMTAADTAQPSLSSTAAVTLTEDIVITANTTWNETAVFARNITITNNARLTLAGTAVISAVNFTLDAGSTLYADGRGYGSASGPGRGTNGSGAWNQAGGGGHGGWGGNGTGDNAGGYPYDNVYQPQEPGSGGGSAGVAGGAGGGTIQLVVSNNLVISGTVTANGLSAGGDLGAGGGGAGGAIWLTADIISGSGLIRANGGDGGHTRYGDAYGRGGGGAGGRIALYANEDEFQGAIQAIGGTGAQAGGPGTVYHEDTLSGYTLLRVDNGSRNGREAGLYDYAYQFDAIELENYGHLRLPSVTTVMTLTNGTFLGDGTSRLVSAGRLMGEANMVIDGVTLVVQGDLTGPDVIETVNSGGLDLYANTPWHTDVYTFSNMIVGSGTTLRLINYINGGSNYNYDLGLTLVADNLTVAAGGVVEANGLGYASEAGPGHGSTGSGPGSQAGGAGYGGWGGDGTGGNAGGAPYGDVQMPTVPGSGGGHTGGYAGGAGGGALHLVIHDTLIVSGTISSNGRSASGDLDAGGGGAGGSIWLDTYLFQGSGLIRANGGDGGSTRYGNAYGRGGGGAGGRIAIYADDNQFAGTLEARGGNGGQVGGAGTVYLENRATNLHMLMVDNGNRNGRNASLPAVDYAFDTLSLTGQGHLEAAGNLAFDQLTGDNTANLTVADVLTATNVLTITGVAQINVPGQILVNNPFVISHSSVDVTGELVGAADVMVIENSRLLLYAQSYPSGTLTLDHVTISTGTLTLVSSDNGDADFNNDVGFTLLADTISVSSGGAIEANGRGYALTSGPGAHVDGASHGGVGGGGLPVYGSVYEPATLGSSGDGGRGGGAIHLIIANALLVDGAMQANGVQDGSGGSVWVETDIFNGSGIIAANGGSSSGGGGRVAVYASYYGDFDGNYAASFGGGVCPVANCNGTVHLNSADPLLSTLIVTPTIQVADGHISSTVTALLKTSVNMPLAGEGLELMADPGSDLFINGQPGDAYVYVGDSDADGLVTAVITATEPGVHLIHARTTTGVPLLAQVTVTFTVGAVDSSNSHLAVDRSVLLADGQDTATVQVTLLDSLAHPVSGKVALVQTSGSVTVTQPLTVTDSSGQVTAMIRSADMQTVTVTAWNQSDGFALAETAVVTFTYPPADLDHAQFAITPTLLAADGQSTAVITTTLRDRLGRPLANRPVTLQVTGSSNIISPTGQTTTDASGTAVFTLASTRAETKNVTVRDVYGQTTLAVGSLTFVPVPVDATHSQIVVRGSRRAAADGQHAVMVEVTARDRFDNPVSGVAVVLTSTSPVQFVQPPVTDFAGRAAGFVSSNQAIVGDIAAFVDGTLLAGTVQVIFEGPDLAVTHSGPAEVTIGYPLDYSVSVANEGFLTATNVLITQTLPGPTTFISQTSPFSYTYDAAADTVVWQVGTLPAGTAVSFAAHVQVSSGASNGSSLVSHVHTTATEVEVDVANNDASVSTLATAPKPNLAVSPGYPTLVVAEGLTKTLVIEVRNRGTAVLQNATIAPPAHTPWASLSQTSLGDLLPGQSVTVTLTANAAAISQNGQYRDRVRVSTGNAGSFDIFLTIKVQAPSRDLQLTLTNDISNVVKNAHVVLIESIYVNTEGSASTSTFYREGYTDANGQLTFRGLESGKNYSYQIEATNHEKKSGYVSVTAGNDTQLWDAVLIGKAALSVRPGQVEFSMLRGDLAQQTLLLHNTGNAPITNITLAASGIPFLYLGQPPVGTVLNPGQMVAVTVNAAPLLTETIGVDVYHGNIAVNTATGAMATVPVTVNLLDEYARTLCLKIETDRGDPLTQALVRLKDLEGQIIATGSVTDTVQQVYQQSTDHDGPGYSCFPDLHPGPYHADIGRGEIRLGAAEIEVVVGEGIQEEVIVVDEPAVTADFTVIPTTIEDVYTTVFTLTFIPHEAPRLALSPQKINLCGDDDGVVTQTITLHNFYPVTLTNAYLELEYYGNVNARVTHPNGILYTDGSQPLLVGTIPPESHMQFELRASVNMAVCSGDEGTILITVNAEHEHYVPESWYRIDATPGLVQPGQQAHIPMRLANTGFPDSSNLNSIPPDLENVTLVPPRNLTWITTSVTTIDKIPVGEEVAFDLIVEPPQWLPEGMYYDSIQVFATNGITALIGIEAEMTAAGLRVETQFVTPIEPGEGGTPPPPPPPPPDQGQPQPPWDDIVTNWNPDVFGPQDVVAGFWHLVVGCYCYQGGGGGGWAVVGNHLVSHSEGGGNFSFAYSPDFKDNVVILQLEQRFSLDREAFNAYLSLNNGLSEEITDVQISLVFMSGQSGEIIPTREQGDVITSTGVFTPVLPDNSIIPPADLIAGTPARWQKLYPVNFIIIPKTPTDIGMVPGGSSQLVNWTLVPDAPGLTEQGFFDVRAIIHYKVNGVDKELVTSQASISVSPQPRIMIDYYLPNYVLGGQTFDWLVVATNIGYGTARNFRVETPQPKIIKQSERYPTDFTLIGPSVLSWGNVAPGEQVSGTWRILPSQPGSFVDWEATCKHQNFMGVELPQLVYCEPRVHFIDTSYLAESQQWGKGDSCISGLFQAFTSDPVNTFSGNFTHSEMDVSIPTWNGELAFERSYNSRDTKDGPLGPGWTHNFNMDLTYESFIGMDAEGIIGQQTYFSARLPHGSMVYFDVSSDGNTITPFPGVQAQLARDFVTYTLTTNCDHTVYTFNAQQQLTSITDIKGNQTTLAYDVDDNLIEVQGPAGRTLSFAYDSVGHIVQMTDPLGRTTQYTYALGYLAEVTDFRGQVTRYTYTLPQQQQPGQLTSITDPNGHTQIYNHYDNEYRVDWQEDALGNRTTLTYGGDNEHRVTTMTDPLGNTTTDTYNEDGLVIRRTDTLGYFETYAYDENYNPIQETDKNGHVTLYSWPDSCCDMDQIVDPMGNTSIITFGPQNEVVSIENERGYATAMTYDGSLNLLTATDALGGVVSYAYGSHGEKLSKTDENGHTTYYVYDSYGNTAVITDALGYAVHMEYDAAGRLLHTTDALSRTTSYIYDPGNNVLTTTNPISGTHTFVYDNVGNMIQSVDPLGRMTTYRYSARNEIVETVNPLGDSKGLTYDAIGTIVAETDENGNTTTYDYGGLSVTTTDPEGNVSSVTTDPVGNVIQEIDANGNVTQHTYDANDRLVQTVHPDGSLTSYLYDEADHLVSMTDGEGRIMRYQYDALGRRISETDPLSGTTTYAYDAVGNRISMVDAEGRLTQHVYDAANRLTQMIDSAGSVTTYTYDEVGNKIAYTDANGNTAVFVYDDLDRLIQVTDPLSGTTRYAYDGMGNQTEVIDPLGHATRIVYDDMNRPVQLTNAAGYTVTYEYDGVNNLLSTTDEEGRTTTYVYDGLNRPIIIVDAAANVFTYTYDGVGNLLLDTDANGRSTTYTYDALNQLIQVTNPLSGTTSYAYDLVGNRSRMTDANGHSTNYTYDGLDRVVEMVDTLGGTTRYDYDAVGNLLTLTDAAGNATHYAYDALNRPVVTTDAFTGTVNYAYDAVGNLLALTDAAGRTTTFRYDALNHLIQTRDPLDNRTLYAYDAVGNHIYLEDARGYVTTYGYDVLNQLITITSPISGTTVYTYTASGNLLAEQNPAGQVRTYSYDALDRPVIIKNALGQPTHYTFDPLGNLLRITDPLSRTTTFTYDALNRLVQTTDALGGITTSTYDAVGNQRSRIDANGHSIQYVYDDLNRLTQVTDPLGQVLQMTYDAVGNQLTLTDPLSRTTTYAYDNLYRLTTVVNAAGGVTAYAYDAVGNNTAVTDPAGRLTAINYDALDRPITITNALNGTVTFAYDEVGNQVSQTDPAGHTYTYVYDALNRLQRVSDPAGGVTAYAYDPMSNLQTLTDALNRVTTYQYDSLNRLTAVIDPLGGVSQFTYDPVGNLIRERDPLGSETHYAIDALNRVITITDALNSLTTSSYDPVGNLLTVTDANGHTTTMAYDALDRLVHITDPLGNVQQYQYDAVGNNTAVIDPLGQRVDLTYDALDRLTTMTDPLNQTVAYTYDPVGNTISMVDGNGIVTNYNYDALDRLTAVTENAVTNGPINQETNVTTQYSYDPSGNLTAIANPLGNQYTFSYDALNRMVSAADPLGFASTYQYDALGNLAQMVDANASVTSYTYDALNRLTFLVRPDEAVGYTYDAVGNRLSMSDATGTTTYDYDALYRPLRVTDPLSQVVNYGYDAGGNRTSLVYPDGAQVTYDYDAANRLNTVTDWDSGLTGYEYDENGRLVQVTLPNGITGTFGYDAANQMTLLQYDTVTGTLSSYVYTYDAVGNRTQAIETQVQTEVLPTAAFTATPRSGIAPFTVTFYNASTNANSYVWTFGDGQVFTTTSTAPLTHVYTQTGLYTITLAAETSEFSHIFARTAYIQVLPANAFQEIDGQVVLEAESVYASIPRDGHDWITRTSFNGYTGTSYLQVLPDVGALYATDYITSSPELQYQINFSTPGDYVVWVYGTGINAGADSIHVGINGTANPGSAAITGFWPQQWRWSAHTATGMTATLTIPTAGLYTLNVWAREDGFRFDRILLTQDTSFVPSGQGPAESPHVSNTQASLFASPLSDTITWFSIKEGGNVAGGAAANTRANALAAMAMILGNPGLLLMGPLALLTPLANSRRYRRRRWAQILASVLVVLVLFGVGYSFVNGGSLVDDTTSLHLPTIPDPSQRGARFNPKLAATTYLPDASALAALAQQQALQTTVIDYAYDPLYRLTHASYSSGETYSYSYDAAGNRTSYTQNGVPVESYLYDAANRLLQVNSQVYTYDNNGNLLDDGAFAYTYDTANRLTQVTDGVSLAQYQYNGDGARVAQTVDGLRTDYVQDVIRPLPQVLTARQGGTISKYLYGLGLIGENRAGTGQFATPATWQYLLPDALGSIRQIADASGQIIGDRDFDPFGGLLAATGSATSNYGFAGEQQDPLTGYLYMRARTYNPASGRFLQQDSVLGDLSQPRTLHRYAYAFNNPITYTDPGGTMPSYRTGPVQGGNNIPGASLRAASHSQAKSRSVSKLQAGSGNYVNDAGGGGGPGGLCGFLISAIESGKDLARELIDLSVNFIEMTADVVRFFGDGDFRHLADAHEHLQDVGENISNIVNNPLVEMALIMAISFSPIGTLLDVVSLVTGVDPLTGQPLTDLDRALTVAGLLLGGLDDLEMLLPSGSLGGGLDEVSDFGRAGGDLDNIDDALRDADEASALNKLDNVDELADVGDARHLADLEDATELRRGGEAAMDYVDNAADLSHVDNVTENLDEVAEIQDVQHAQNTGDMSHVEGVNGSRSDEVVVARTDNQVKCPANSFVAGTLVTTDEGQVPIEEIQVGDKVLGEDPETGEQGYFEVVALTDHPTDEILQIVVTSDDGDDGTTTSTVDHAVVYDVMLVTPDHPVYVEGRGWVLAENLGLGERLRRADGGMAKVLSIDQLESESPQSVYNFTVEGAHTYFVLDEEVLVHNVGKHCGNYAPAKESGYKRDMQDKLIDSLDEDGVIAVRSRPYEAAGLEVKYDPKEQWVKDWMVTENYDNGVRKLLDADDVRAGKYKHVHPVEDGYMIGAKGSLDGPNIHVTNEMFEEAASKGYLNGQKVLSDVDVAGYTRNGVNISDDELKYGVAARFNASYGHDVIVHGHLYNGLNLKPGVAESLAKNPGRIEGLRAGEVYLFDKGGYIGKMPFSDYERYVERELTDFRSLFGGG